MFTEGPKNYAFETYGGKSVCKVRGFSLNFKNVKLLNFETMKSLINRSNPELSIFIQNDSKISRAVKRHRIIKKGETKFYQMVYMKRAIIDENRTLSYVY